MQVEHSFTIWIDGDDIEVESPVETVRELLRMASDAAGKCKHDRVLIAPSGVEFYNKNLTVYLRHGDQFRTRK